MPQGKVRILVSTAPKRPIRPRRLLLITGATESPAERLERIEKTIHARCAGFLSPADFRFFIVREREPPKPLAIEGPKPAKAKTKRQKAAPAPRIRGKGGRFAPRQG
jgi:hypothetical protein